MTLDPFGSPIGPPRIWDESGDGPGLMMSRSFGDQMGHRVGMTSKPEVKIVTKDASHKFLIVGSDGLWEKTSEMAFLTIGRKMVREKQSAEKMCKELMVLSTTRYLNSASSDMAAKMRCHTPSGYNG